MSLVNHNPRILVSSGKKKNMHMSLEFRKLDIWYNIWDQNEMKRFISYKYRILIELMYIIFVSFDCIGQELCHLFVFDPFITPWTFVYRTIFLCNHCIQYGGRRRVTYIYITPRHTTLKCYGHVVWVKVSMKDDEIGKILTLKNCNH